MNRSSWLIATVSFLIGAAASATISYSRSESNDAALRASRHVEAEPIDDEPLSNHRGAAPAATTPGSAELSDEAKLEIQRAVREAMADVVKDMRSVQQHESEAREPTEEEKQASAIAYAQGSKVIEGALEQGVWDDAFATQLMDLDANMLPDQRHELHKRIVQAINHDALKVTARSIF
jgi:hypothetical protein